MTTKLDKKTAIEFLKHHQMITSDLMESDGKADFLGLYENNVLIGTVGAEFLGRYALLRSLCVTSARRQEGTGAKLVKAMESYCARMEYNVIYLLTDSAERFFHGLGYSTIQRSEAPATILNTPQACQLCPADAVIMRKDLTLN